MNSYDFIKESNRIEGIHRNPTKEEIQEFDRFMDLDNVLIGDLTRFVKVYQPDAKLRKMIGLNVYIGDHVPILGGQEVEDQLLRILHDITYNNAYETHLAYETLHPFTDGNGRSGRMLWAWQMRDISLGFLHRFYYQTLSHKI